MGASIVTGFTQHASRAELEMQALEHEDGANDSSKPEGAIERSTEHSMSGNLEQKKA